VRTVAIVIVIVAACHAGPPAIDASTAFCTDQQPLAPTYTNVQRLFDGSCTVCHAPGVELVLVPATSYANLVGRPAVSYANPMVDESCGGVLVTPSDPDHSYLYLKLATTPCAGSQMPLSDIGISEPLAPCALALVHDWIAAGAAND
jgi:hypothetical protein